LAEGQYLPHKLCDFVKISEEAVTSFAAFGLLAKA
jgi:hypothetical protein